jgi:hypothetical protein
MGDSRLWVRRYMVEGWSVVLIPRGEKGPRVPDWQNTTFKEEDFGAEDNIGVRRSAIVQAGSWMWILTQGAIAAARVLLIQSHADPRGRAAPSDRGSRSRSGRGRAAARSP